MRTQQSRDAFVYYIGAPLALIGFALVLSLVGVFQSIFGNVGGGLVLMGGAYGLRIGAKAVWRRMHRPPPPEPLPANAMVIGHAGDGSPVGLTPQQMAAHGLIVGASGSGKTTTLLKLICEQIMAGGPVIAVDLKGSNTFGATMAEACQAAGRTFAFWRPDSPGYYNPLAYGDASELKDKLISFERFSEPHYQRAAERYLQTAIQVLQQARPDRPVTLAAVVNLLDPNNLKQLLPRVPKELMQRVGPYISNLSRDQQSAVMGLQSRLALISESSLGAWLQPGDPPLDPWQVLDGRSSNVVVLFSLNSSRYGKLAAQIAALIIQDLTAAAGYRLGLPHKPLALVAIDEFSSLDADNILALIAKAREAGISVVLCTQEMADLERLAKGFKDQVLGNVAFTAIHRQNVPDSAELVARMIGTNTVWKHTHQTEIRGGLFGRREVQTGRGSMREVEQFRIHPNVIKDLPTGAAIITTKIPYSTATLARIHPWQPPIPGNDH